MATVRNFDLTANKFNVVGICTRGKCTYEGVSGLCNF